MFGSSYRELQKTEGSRNRCSTVQLCHVHCKCTLFCIKLEMFSFRQHTPCLSSVVTV